MIASYQTRLIIVSSLLKALPFCQKNMLRHLIASLKCHASQPPRFGSSCSLVLNGSSQVIKEHQTYNICKDPKTVLTCLHPHVNGEIKVTMAVIFQIAMETCTTERECTRQEYALRYLFRNFGFCETCFNFRIPYRSCQIQIKSVEPLFSFHIHLCSQQDLNIEIMQESEA